MTPMSVILYTVVTVGVLFSIMAILYYVLTARRIKQQQKRFPTLMKDLKPGVKIVFAGGLIGTLVSKDKDNVFAKVRLNDQTVVDIAVYSIANILDK